MLCIKFARKVKFKEKINHFPFSHHIYFEPLCAKLPIKKSNDKNRDTYPLHHSNDNSNSNTYKRNNSRFANKFTFFV